MNFVPFLKKVYFFRDLDDAVLDGIAGLCNPVTEKAGTVLFNEGDPADCFYMVYEGSVEVWKESASGNKDLLAVHGAGHLFGEMALIDELPRSATVVVREDSRLFTIGRDDFRSIIQQNSDVALSILRSVSSMIRKSNDTYVNQLQRRNVELERMNTELRQAQRELVRAERLSTLGKFSSMIIHDIRNPLSVLKGYAQMISMKPDMEKIPEYAGKIVAEAERLNRLAGELLDYSRGEIRLNLSAVSVPALLSQVRSVISEPCRMRGIKIVDDFQSRDSVLLDQDRMFRSLLNVCDNSRKAMPRGGTLTITSRRDGEDLLIEISDTGVGMTPDVMEQIFEPFFSSADAGGTGLGMLIVKNVVEAHDGRLVLESEPGKGTLVRIILPYRG